MKTRSTKVLVFNGWAAGLETWSLTSFHRDWTFSYLEELDGLPRKVIEDSDSVVLVGFSMGSTIALSQLIEHPEKIEGLALVSATPRMMEDVGWRGFSEHRMEALRIGTEMVFRGNPSPFYAPENLHRGLEYLARTDLRADLERTIAEHPRLQSADFPVSIVHSDRDGIVRAENVEYFKRCFPQAEVEFVPGTEHVLPVKAPDVVDRAVERII